MAGSCSSLPVVEVTARTPGCRRAHDAPVEPCDRDGIAGFCNRVLGGAVKGRIGLGEEFVESRDRLNVRPVVDVVADRNALGDFRHSAEMITVPVRGDQMIDLSKAGVLRGPGEWLGVADRLLRR